MKFSVLSLKYGQISQEIEKKELKKLISEDVYIEEKNIHRKITVSFYDDRFFKIFFLEGDKYPYQEKVFNKECEKYEDNPKKAHQIEDRRQLFVLIDIKTQRIYISNFNNRNQITNWMTEKIGKEIVTESILDRKKCMESFKKIHTLKLAGEASVIKQEGALDDVIKLQTESEGKILIEFSFKETLASSIKREFSKLFDSELSNLSSYCIKGEDQSGASLSLDLKKILEKLTIDVEKQNNGLYSHEEVFDLLVKELMK